MLPDMLLSDCKISQPMHGFGSDEMHAAVQSAKVALENVMGLLQFDKHEEVVPLVTMIGDASC